MMNRSLLVILCASLLAIGGLWLAFGRDSAGYATPAVLLFAAVGVVRQRSRARAAKWSAVLDDYAQREGRRSRTRTTAKSAILNSR